MASNKKKSIGLAIIIGIVVTLVGFVVLQEEDRIALSNPENIIVVEVDPISVHESEFAQMNLRDSLITFAQQFMDVPYEYASCDPEEGFDCSGFVFYVFDSFGIDCPRTSRLFATAGKEVKLQEIRKADVLVFTGTDASVRRGGHVGIVLSVGDSISFIHSSSGSANGVTISYLEEPHYRKRFLTARDLISM